MEVQPVKKKFYLRIGESNVSLYSGATWETQINRCLFSCGEC